MFQKKAHSKIYAYLKRLGYIVQRASEVDRLRASTSASLEHKRILMQILFGWRKALSSFAKCLIQAIRWCLRSICGKPRGLLGISANDSYGKLFYLVFVELINVLGTIFEKLQIVSTSGFNSCASSLNPQNVLDNGSLKPFYYAWRPATHFKRTHPPPPEFRICVLETHKHPMLTVHDFDTLFSHVPLSCHGDIKHDDKELEQIRAQNRRAYGKQRVPRVRNKEPHSSVKFRFVLARLAWFQGILHNCAEKLGISIQGHQRELTNVYIPLKAGRRSVVVAIVDHGTTSLLRFGEARFLEWPLASHNL